MLPKDYYNQLVATYGAKRYLRPDIDDSLMDKIIIESNISVDSSTRQRLLKDFLPRKGALIIDHLVDSTFSAIPENEARKLQGRIYAGEFPTGDFNACAVKVPGGNGYVFLLNVGLMSLIYEAAKVVFSQVMWASFDGKGKVVPGTISGTTEMSYKKAGHHLCDMIRTYVRLEQYAPTGKRVVIQGETKIMLVGMFVLATEKFVMAHEFGHALLGHLDSAKSISMSLPNVDTQLSVISKSWENEFKADLTAGALLLGGLPKKVDDRLTALEVEMAIAGPFFFFELARLIEKVEGVKYTSHPPTDQRFRVLEEAFKQALPEQAFSIQRSTVTLLRKMEQFL